MSDGDEGKAIASSHLPPMDFSGNCCRKAVTLAYRRMSLVHHANCRTFLRGGPMMVWPILVGTSGNVAPRTHIKSHEVRLVWSTFAAAVWRPCCTLAVVGGCTVLFMV